MTPVLDKPSSYFRGTVAKGIVPKDEPAIERDGGKFNAGLIRRVSVITTGEALGHDLWVDQEMLSQVANAINSSEQGIKARFAHPSLSGDGIGKATAKAFNATVEGDRVLADLHMLETAHRSPDGDLAGYVMDLALEAPEDFGTSIVFKHDYSAEKTFQKNNVGKDGRFVSPDELNVNNYPHARLSVLRAVDVVDTPATNPNGLFHADPFAMLEGGEAILDYAFGLKDEIPDAAFGIDATRYRGFVARWSASRNVALKGIEEMTEPVKTGETGPVETFSAEQLAEKVKAATELGRTEALSGLKQFTEMFGTENGPKWFAEGISLADAKDRQIAALQEANKSLAEKLSSSTGGLGETEPLTGSGQQLSGDEKQRAQLAASHGENIAKIAMSKAFQVPQPSRN